MDIVASVISGSQSAHLMKPADRAFDNPAINSQPASMFGISLRQHRFDSPLPQLVAMRLRVVRPIALHSLRSPTRSTRLAAHRRNGFDERQQLRDVVGVGAGERRGQRKINLRYRRA